MFSREDMELIEAVCREHGSKTAKVLSDLSNREPAWHDAEMREKLSPELMAYGIEEDADGL